MTMTYASAGPYYVAPAVSITTPANPTAPTTAAFKMQGVGGLITPALPPGIVLVNLTGNATWVTSGAVGVGISLQLYIGQVISGVAIPVNAGNIPSNAKAIGAIQNTQNGVVLTTIGDNVIPISMTALATGLSQGSQYWVDVAAISLTTSSDCFLSNLTLSLVEIG